MLSPRQAIPLALKRSFEFKGRSRRSEFWWLNAFIIVGLVIFAMLDIYILPEDPNLDDWGNSSAYGLQAWLDLWSYSLFATTFGYATLPAFTAVAIRRLHDIGRRGWPIIGLVIVSELMVVLPSKPLQRYGFENSITTPSMTIWDTVSLIYVVVALIYFGLLLYMLLSALRDSHPGDSRYGPSPKYHSGASVFD